MIRPLVLTIVFCFLSFDAYGLPSYSLKEKVRCGYCHITRSGGGPRSSRGIWYGKYHSFTGWKEQKPPVEAPPQVTVAKRPEQPTPKSKIPPKPTVIAKRHEKETPPKRVETPPKEEIPPEIREIPPTVEVTRVETKTPWTDRVHWGADLLFWLNGNRMPGAPKKFGLEQMEPWVTINVNEAINGVFAYNFANPLLTAYGQYLFPQHEDFYLKVGSFHAPIGLPYVDHEALIKERNDIGSDTRDVGIEIGFSKDLDVQFAFVNGGREPIRFGLPPFYVADTNFGYIGNISLRGELLDVPFIIGTSALYERRVPPGINPPGEIPAVVIPGTNPPGPASPLDNTTLRADTFLFDAYFNTQIRRFDLLGEIAFGQNTPYVLNNDPKNSMAFFAEIRYQLTNWWRLGFRYDNFMEDLDFTGTYVQRFVPWIFWQFAEYASASLQYRGTFLVGNATPFLTAPRAANDSILLEFHFWI